MPFPRALSLSHRAELSAAPPLPVRSCTRPPLSLLCSGLSTPRHLSHSLGIFPSRLSITFVALLRTQIALCPPYTVAPKPAPSAGGEAAQHSTAQRGQPLLPPGGSAGPEAPQCLVGPQGTLLTHIQFAFSQNPQMPFHRAVLQPSSPYPGSALSHVQDPALALNLMQLVITPPSILSRSL